MWLLALAAAGGGALVGYYSAPKAAVAAPALCPPCPAPVPSTEPVPFVPVCSYTIRETPPPATTNSGIFFPGSERLIARVHKTETTPLWDTQMAQAFYRDPTLDPSKAWVLYKDCGGIDYEVLAVRNPS